VTCYLSVDWGGTSFRAAVIRPGKKVEFCRKSAANIRTASVHQLELLAQSLFDDNLHGINDRIVWLIGAAGGADLLAARRVKEVFLELSPTNSVCEIFTDFVCNHASALGGKDGIISVNGTGSLLYADIGNTRIRKGGWGYLLDRSPSGSRFGLLVLRSVLEYLEGDKSREKIYNSYLQQGFKGDKAEILDSLYQAENHQNYLGRFAEVLTCAYNDGDQLAESLVKESFSFLGNDLAKLTDRFSEEIPLNITGCGGLWQNWSSFADLFSQMLNEQRRRFILTRPVYKPVFGPLIHWGKNNSEGADIFAELPEEDKEHD
jgi:N-acetylglucosamine kinase-like BadF-type ATPase